MIWKIYWVGVALYFGCTMGAFHKIEKILENAYEESQDFKDIVDNPNSISKERENYWKERGWKTKLEAIAIGFCPILHWIGALMWGMLALNDELFDELIREALDKILN